MLSQARQGPRRFRRILRTFFAYRYWLLAALFLGAIAAGLVSALEPTTYRGRMELASATDSSPARVVLPDVVRLRQLVFGQESLATLLPDQDIAFPQEKRQLLLAQLASTIVLEPISSPTAPSSVWRLCIDIPAPDRLAAQARLEQYADQINREFRNRVDIARRGQRNHSPADSSKQIVPVGYQPTTENPDPSISPDENPDDPIGELAKQFGVPAEQLPAIVDSVRAELERRAREIESHDRNIDELVSIVNRLESGDITNGIAPAVHEDVPTIHVLLVRRDDLIAKRAKLAESLKPAHPDYQSVERTILEVENRLKIEMGRAAESYRAKIGALEAANKKMRNNLATDRRRLDALEALVARRATAESTTAPTTSFATTEDVEEPRSIPSIPSKALPVSPGLVSERPIGRVVLPTPTVDPTPVRPKTTRNVLLTMAGILLAYIGFVAVRAQTDQRVLGTDDLEELGIDLQVFGSIPAMRSCEPVDFARSR